MQEPTWLLSKCPGIFYYNREDAGRLKHRLEVIKNEPRMAAVETDSMLPGQTLFVESSRYSYSVMVDEDATRVNQATDS